MVYILLRFIFYYVDLCGDWSFKFFVFIYVVVFLFIVLFVLYKLYDEEEGYVGDWEVNVWKDRLFVEIMDMC